MDHMVWCILYGSLYGPLYGSYYESYMDRCTDPIWIPGWILYGSLYIAFSLVRYFTGCQLHIFPSCSWCHCSFGNGSNLPKTASSEHQECDRLNGPSCGSTPHVRAYELS